uniref:EF-hand domain-containing protein n=1 Tax=Plectus sambesii TaxID=2011161 RepID=A0A914XCX6_9BILA
MLRLASAVFVSLAICRLHAASISRLPLPEVVPMDDFLRADANKDKKLNLDEFLRKDPSYVWVMEDNFARYDADRDGFVTKAEYDVIANAEKEAEEQMEQENWRVILEDFDKNGDGFLQFDEMTQYLTTADTTVGKEKYQEVFSRFDTHKDMKLDMKEFDDYLVNIAPFLFDQTRKAEQAAVNNEPTSDQEFKTADANKDNKLNFEEFLHKDPYHLKLVTEEFKKFDANADGIVTRAEYDEKVKADSQDQFRKFVAEFDTNGDKELQEEEVLNFLSQRHGVKPKNSFAFNKFDTKSNGALDTSELGQFDANLPWEEMEDIEAETERPLPTI